MELHPGSPDPVELELETTKWYVVDAMIASINSGYLERDKAVELLEIWFEPDQIAVAAIYRNITAR